MKKLFYLLLLGIITGGCMFIRMRTSGFLDHLYTTQSKYPFSQGVSFFVLENPDAENPIFEKEIKAKIEKLLINQGYTIGDYMNADYYIVFGYAIDSGHNVTTPVPIYHPGETIYHTGRVNVYTSDGSYGWGDYYGTTTTPGYFTYIPASRREYTRRFQVKVLDANILRNSGKEKVIWVGDTISTGSSSDLRFVINYLLVATFKHFGENTRRAVRTTMSITDKRVKELLVDSEAEETSENE